jgi:hypothetical protein
VLTAGAGVIFFEGSADPRRNPVAVRTYLNKWRSNVMSALAGSEAAVDRLPNR